MTTGKYNLSPAYVPKILFVDDEENILRAMARLGMGENYTVVTTHSPRRALEMIQESVAGGLPFAVVVSDHQMPEMAGTHFLEQVRYVSPETVRILMTGYTEARMAIDAINRGAIYRYVEKPWQDEALKGTLNEAIKQFLKGMLGRRLEDLSKKYQSELQAIQDGNIAPMQPANGQAAKPEPEQKASLVAGRESESPTVFISPEVEHFMARYERLTRREKDLLYCIVRGYSNQQIADELSISITTVKNHIGNIFRKLEVANRTQAAMMATTVFVHKGAPSSEKVC